jgi:large subunit ribosomal protein L1
MTDLRAKARKEGVYLRIVKNTLARKALAGTAFECISPALKENLMALMADLQKIKPATSKGVYLKRVTLSSTMGPGVAVDQASLGLL